MSGLADLKAKLTKYTPGGGDQAIDNDDFYDIILSILEAQELAAPLTLTYVDATAVRIEATADCAGRVLMKGFPNILHPSLWLNAALSDGEYREVTANVTMDFDLAPCLWGSEKSSQWYAIYAIAGDADTDFDLKAMPWMRFSSEASQIITLRNNANTADIGYGFTTDELADYKIYILSGASKGLIRTITHNNNDSGTGGTITYSGAALTMTQGDWFIVLPDTNFCWMGDIYNNYAGNISYYGQNPFPMISKEKSFADVTSFTFTNLLPGKRYRLTVQFLQNTLAGTYGLLFNGDNGTNYNYSLIYDEGSATPASLEIEGTGSIGPIHGNAAASYEVRGEIGFSAWISNPQNVTVTGHFYCREDGANAPRLHMVGGDWLGASDLASLTFSCNTGTMTGVALLEELD
jgi:hypothetical protein